jgi:hypothetical protein
MLINGFKYIHVGKSCENKDVVLNLEKKSMPSDQTLCTSLYRNKIRRTEIVLKTLLYYLYEHEGKPYVNPPHYFFKDAIDTTMNCQAFVRVLIEYMMFLPASETNRKIIMNVLAEIHRNNKGHNPRIYRGLLNEFISHFYFGISKFEAALGFIVSFWKRGVNILPYLNIILTYTEDFFSDNDVANAIEIAEYELGMENILYDQWVEILKCEGVFYE